jgi:hypothetical protein
MSGFGINPYTPNQGDVGFDFGSHEWDPCELENGIYDIRLNAHAPESYSFKITKTNAETDAETYAETDAETDAETQGHYLIEIPTEHELKTHSKFNSFAGNIQLINNNIGKPLFIDGLGLDVGQMMIKFERVDADGNIYKLTCDSAPANGGGGMSGRGSHKQRMNTRRRSRRRRRRTYQKKRVSSKRYRRRSVRSRKN